ncbi:MAG: FtsQ-type POTRA domain-containing protein [Ruminococcus sp.]|nr:FtsQ-type POTRA domain-containing protein [Ruminococcus sp.]
MDDKTAEIPSLKKFTQDSKKKTASGRSGASQKVQNSKNSNHKPDNTKKRNSGNRAERTKSTSAPAPRTYARQRQDVSEAIARTQVINTKEAMSKGKPAKSMSNEFSSEPLRRQMPQEPVRRAPKSSENRTSLQRRNQTPHTDLPQRKPSGTPVGESKKPRQSKNRSISPRARKFRKTVINIALCLAVLVAGVILSLTVLFKTESITVSGNGSIPKNDIISVSGLTLGENIFTAPKARAEAKLEKAYPYIKEAEVKSVFPSGISIEITMASPACVVEGLGGYYIVSSQGKVLEVSSTTDEIEAPVIEGINVGGKVAGEFVEFGSTVTGESLREMFTAFEELGATRITAINVAEKDEAVELKYVYDNRIVVYLGIPEHITYKIQTAQTIIKEKLDVSGTMIAGDLDVSMCYDSMKSYFNQYTLLSPNSSFVTELETTSLEEPTTAPEEYYPEEEYPEEEYLEEEYPEEEDNPDDIFYN